jgi:hypothetical protein
VHCIKCMECMKCVSRTVEVQAEGGCASEVQQRLGDFSCKYDKFQYSIQIKDNGPRGGIGQWSIGSRYVSIIRINRVRTIEESE